MRKAAILFLCLSALISNLLLPLDPEKQIDQYLLEEWKIPQGLPSDAVRAIAQTPDGYLWLGIGNTCTLARFDGVRFNIFKNRSGLKHADGAITWILAGADGILWIGSTAGLTRFDPQNSRFKTFSAADGLKGNGIYYLYKDIKGNFWGVSYDDGYLNCFKPSGNNSITVLKVIKKGNHRISTILEDKSGQMLIGTMESGLLKYLDGKFIPVHLDGLEGDYSVFSLYENRAGILWVGTNRGLVRVNPEKAVVYTPRDGLSDNHITAISEDYSGNLWAGTFNGLNRLSTDSSGKATIEKILPNALVACLFEDREKNLWVGTSGAGLKRLGDSPVITYTTVNGLNNDFIFSLFKDRSGAIWVGSFGGLNRWDGREFLRYPSLTAWAVSAIGQDPAGNLWIGAYGSGVLKAHGTDFANALPKKLLTGNFVTCLYISGGGIAWIGTDYGLNRFINGRMEAYTFPGDSRNNYITFASQDSADNLWFGTYSGLRLLPAGSDPLQFNPSQTRLLFEGTRFNDLYQDGAGNYWLCTYGSGLIRLPRDLQLSRSFSFNEKHGLNSRNFYQILEDDQDYLWLSSDRGIVRASRSQLDDCANGIINSLTCTLYSVSDGMKNSECIYTAIKTNNHRLWFGTKKGIAVFDTGNIKINKLPPPVIIESITVNRHSIPKNSNDLVFPNVKNLEIHFTAPTFISPGRVTYKATLENEKRKWQTVPPSRQRRVSFKNLPAGVFRFRVIAGNSDGIWNETGDSFSFTIQQPFYKGVLFILPMILLSLGLILGLAYLAKRRFVFHRSRKKYRHSPMTQDDAKVYVKRLSYAMGVEKVFKDENLTLQGLAKRLEISPRILSQVINEQVGTNYSNFVNEHRIREARQLLSKQDSKDISVLRIAFDVGFGSKAVFNRAFKKFTGMSPTQYRKSAQHHR